MSTYYVVQDKTDNLFMDANLNVNRVKYEDAYHYDSLDMAQRIAAQNQNYQVVKISCEITTEVVHKRWPIYGLFSGSDWTNLRRFNDDNHRGDVLRGGVWVNNHIGDKFCNYHPTLLTIISMEDARRLIINHLTEAVKDIANNLLQ